MGYSPLSQPGEAVQVNTRISNAVLAGAGLALVAASVPAHAQFGGILRRVTNGASSAAAPDPCAEGSSSSAGSRAIGNILGGVARDAAYDAGVSSYVPMAEFSDQLSTAIACQLDPEEQQQAAEATLEATRGGGEDGSAPPEVGQMAAWQSNTRDDVSGTSTVTARDDGELDCIVVTDVIIVRGEETRADKRMCRPPGSARYSIIA